MLFYMQEHDDGRLRNSSSTTKAAAGLDPPNDPRFRANIWTHVTQLMQVDSQNNESLAVIRFLTDAWPVRVIEVGK